MNCRTFFVTISLLLPIFFVQFAVAEQEVEEVWDAEQRQSGGKLLRFLFGDGDEEEVVDPDDEKKSGDLTPDEEMTKSDPAVPTEGDADDNKESTEKVQDTITVQELVPNETEVNHGLERGGLIPPPGFILNSSPENNAVETEIKPAKSIVVEELPAPSKSLVNQPVDSKDANSDAASALDRLEKENPVVAVVEGDRIYWADIIQAARKLPEQYQGQLETMFPILLDRAIDLKLLAHAGANANMDETEAVKRRLALAEERIIREAFLEQELDAMISESMLNERYFDLLRENIVNAEVRARHILVETRNEALALIIALENGADFALLAKKFSRGPSAEKGGDLGWFRRKDMDPEFAESAFALKIGMISKVPVATEFGWHVIKLEDKREVKQPTYESMRSEIRKQVSQELIAQMVRDLRKEANISVFPAK